MLYTHPHLATSCCILGCGFTCKSSSLESLPAILLSQQSGFLTSSVTLLDSQIVDGTAIYTGPNQQQIQYRRSIFFLGDFDTRLFVRLRVELLTSDWYLVKDALFSGYSRIRIFGIDANSNLLRSIWFLDMHRTPQQNERDSLLLRIA